MAAANWQFEFFAKLFACLKKYREKFDLRNENLGVASEFGAQVELHARVINDPSPCHSYGVCRRRMNAFYLNFARYLSPSSPAIPSAGSKLKSVEASCSPNGWLVALGDFSF